jgi:hypothetical protein
VARHLAGRAKALPSVEEQKDWEAKREAALGGGKNYYSIAPNYKDFFEFLRNIAGDPEPGTSGIALPQFDDKWLITWADMVAPKIRIWEKASKDDRDFENGRVKAKL